MPNAKKILDRPILTDMPRATDTFTDRLEPRQAFHNLVKRAYDEKFENYYVIDYYGIGGVGKTTLLAQLRKEAVKQYGEGRKKPIILHINFESVIPDRAEVMVELRNQFKKQTNVNMADFDACLERLSELIHIETEKKEKASILTRNKWVSAALDVGGYIPVVNTILSKGTGFIKTGEKLYNAISDKVNDVHAGAMGDSIPLLLDNLPLYFSRDVSKYCEKEDDAIIFVFIDTYERLYAASEGNTRSLKSIEWLWGANGLFENLPNTVITIAGREKLVLDSCENDTWASRVETHLLSHLSETDSCEYLAKCGIMNEALQHELYGLTGGEPVYLDLCVSRYHQLVREKEKPCIGEFGHDTEDLVERHLRYISPDIWDAIYLCALLLRWNDDMLFCVAEQIPLYIQPSQKEIIDNLTYVSKENGTSCMHQVVADVLAKRFPVSSRQKLLAPLLEYGRKHPENVLWGSAAVRICTVFKMYDWFPEIMPVFVSSLIQTEHFDEAVRVTENAWQICEDNGLSNEPAYWIIKEGMGAAYQSTGLFEKAIALYQELYQQRRGSLGEGREETVRARRLLADAYEDAGDKDRTIDELERLLPKAEMSLGSRHIETLAITEALARLYRNRGMAERAIPYVQNLLAVQADTQGYGSFETRYCMDMLFGLYVKTDKKEEAVRIYRVAYETQKQKFGIHHEDTLLALHELAKRCIKTGMADRAVPLLETELEIRKEMPVDEKSSMLDTVTQLAAALNENGETDKAIEMYEAALDGKKQLFGLTHEETLLAAVELSCLCDLTGKKERSDALDKEVLSACRTLQKEGDASVADKIGILASFYEENGKRKASEELSGLLEKR